MFPGKLPPVVTVPYGAPEPLGRKMEASRDGKLKCLFVGTLSQQKGLSYMFEALRMVDVPVEMTVVGRPGRADFQPLNEALSKVNYIPSLPNAKILELMHRQDVLLFPTLFDGFGLVMLEAMSRGCVVVATPNCGASDVLTDGEDGFIVPIRDPQAIAEKLELLYRDRDRLVLMSRAASTKAGKLTWSAYRQTIASAVREVLAEGCA
jgi:glycosyltransferase involved in cell wall biosynthesis